MPTPNGADILLKLDTSATATASYTTVGAMRTAGLKLNNEYVDITNADSARWKEALLTAGTKSIEVNGSVVFTDTTAQKKVMEYAIAGTPRRWEITIPELGTFTGYFVNTSLDFAGEHNKEISESFGLMSSAAIAFVAL